MNPRPGQAPAPAPPPLDTVLFRSDVVTIGAFCVTRGDPRFHDSGPIERHVFVFPRRAVWIQHQGEEAFVADPNLVTLYNRGQRYRRDAIAEGEDRCEWFAPAPSLVREAVYRWEPGAEERPDRPFARSWVRSSPGLYLRQRRLVQRLLAGHPADALHVEETSLALLDCLLAGVASGSPGPTGPRRTAAAFRRQRDLAQAAAALLAGRVRDPLGLGRIADALGVSAGHLCRVFRRFVGTSLHRYRDELRLRFALEEIARGRELTDLALELGYSSHSHFTESFRRAFGEVPSGWREPRRTRSRFR